MSDVEVCAMVFVVLCLLGGELVAWAAVEPEQTRDWLKIVVHHPQKAFTTLWTAFFNSWLAVGTVAGLFYAGAFVPDMFGFGTANAFFVVGNTLFFVKLCFEERLHGPRGARKNIVQRALTTVILFAVFGFLSFLECGSVANKEHGLPPTLHNIWYASLWWKHTDPPPSPAPPPTLLSLFNGDFSYLFKTAQDRGLKFGNGGHYKYKAQLYADYSGKSEFIGFYLPRSPD